MSITIPTWTVEEITQRHTQLDVRVPGFWSAPIRIRCTWELIKGEAHLLVDVSHSTGGLSSDADPLEAELSFGTAVIMAVAEARRIKAMEATLRPAYTAALEARRNLERTLSGLLKREAF
ncbi:hypothetical protein UFOVP1304_56 [uncultured Caudovirales phage]|uniref:Uncharacterized protein n=1 Tax=uncultured Caudovirales phage TaxID=2100421 RepID=A0A6J5RMC9_9CAUD|nr:hypothetical protein UFOVP1304_56 [uncultured Caudovirales phage]